MEVLIIAAIVVFIVDLSGVVQSISELLWKVTKLPYKGWILPKPFSCSLCLTFWFGLLYLLIAGKFTLTGVLLVCLASWFTPVISTILISVRDLFIKLFR